MKKVCIVGLGEVSQYFLRGLQNSELYELVGVCDMDLFASNRNLFKDYPFFLDYKPMIENLHPDLCLVLVNEKDKYEIIKDILELKCGVLSEKPLTDSKEKFDELYEIAKENNALLDVLYHYQYGDEMEFLYWFVRDLGELKTGTILLNEPYAYNNGNKVKDEHLNHTEAWLDNGINALSVFAYLVDLDNFHTVHRFDIRSDDNEHCIYAERLLSDGNCSLRVVVDWRTESNKKYFILEYEKGTVLVDSKAMKVYFNGECVFNMDLSYPRMHHQYEKYFTVCFPLFDYKSNALLHDFAFDLR